MERCPAFEENLRVHVPASAIRGFHVLSPLNLRLLNLIIVVINGCPDGRQVLSPKTPVLCEDDVDSEDCVGH